ncbi:hypothetical protein Calkro_2482 [Caldicellulosiruptor kronotskyensis 2002]|uniref:Uncharacterized protein n=1 Tax=Caldicellulosiruptor kronotskyensis (strain DSM 18902 / VKM B-2412 / 2002) TaxID=632348 RepID=E4SHR8_CALK2|nr:hypothetical protein Calkro_2482 [Caldicellulosiruptor kronotskyensis 2002]
MHKLIFIKWETSPSFQSPNGMLHPPPPQSPKGRLQTVENLEDMNHGYVISIPKGEATNSSYYTLSPQVSLVSIPKGEATNLQPCCTAFFLILCFNPQRGGYKLCPACFVLSSQIVSIPKGEATNLPGRYLVGYYDRSFNPQRGGYKLKKECAELLEKGGFQSPKGRLQTRYDKVVQCALRVSIPKGEATNQEFRKCFEK